jgi:hypothetical protein
MATVKQWSQATTGSVKFDIATNERGNIAQSGQTAAGVKSYSMSNIKSDATFDAANGVYGAFVSLVGGRYDESTGEMTIKKKVVEVEEEEPDPETVEGGGE